MSICQTLWGQTYSKDLEKAAKNGEVSAQRDLGICYLNGSGTKVDDRKAFEWLCQSATADATAQYYLAMMFEEGKVDLTKDKKGYYKILKNSLGSLDNKARSLLQASNPYIFWYMKAASGGNDKAMLKMALVSRANNDEEAAIHYFKLAANHGNSEGQREYQAFVDRLAASGISVKDNDLIIISDKDKSDYIEGEYERIIILNTVSHIGYGVFRSLNVKEIIFQDGDGLLTIDTYGLDCSKSIKELVFNRPVDIKDSGCNKLCPDLLVFNKDVEYIGEDAFGGDKGVKKVVFKKVPKKLECGWHHNFIKGDKNGYLNCDEIEIPAGTEAAFVSLGFDNKKLFEEVGNPLSLSIKLERPNSILSVLQPNELSSIDSLTIVGFMYETDLKILESCKNMRYLNLAKTYITSSPQKKREENANAAALSGLFSLLGQVADAKYTNGDMTALEHAQIAGFSKLMKDATSVTKAEEKCYVPYETLKGMKRLETVILPLRASSIGGHAFYGCTSLKHVVLPPFLSRMGDAAFANCYSLEHIDFPATLTDIGMEKRYDRSDYNGACSFENTKIKKFDFSSCTFKSNGFSDTWIFSFFGNIEELRLPKGISTIRISGNGERLYVPSKVTSLRCSNFNEYHFESSTPPEMEFKPQNCTIYIPKGSTTAYFAKFGETNKYIEE